MKSKTRDSALPRRRSAPALALQKPEHRHRVIPDKRRTADDRRAARALANIAQCCEWQTGQLKGPCRDVHCDDCPLWGKDGGWLDTDVGC